MSTVGENLARIRERIAAAARRSGRSPAEVQLVAVTKKVGIDSIREAIAAGQRLFGESYLQEAAAKIPQLGPGLCFHFIGHLQSNKAKQAAGLFDLIETVDSVKLAALIDRHLGRESRRRGVLVQINIGREPQKSGVLPEEAAQVIREISALPNLEVRGLMAMPPFLDDPEAVRPYFRALRLLSEELRAAGLFRQERPELSMGMSADFEVAIEEGATLVRVGTALFGERPARQ